MTGWNTIHAHHLTYLATLTGLDSTTVFDGAALSRGQLPASAEVGWDGEASRGFYEQEHEDVLTAETGTVYLRLTARSGATSPDGLQDTIDGWIDALRTHYAADKTLGGALRQGSNIAVGRVDLTLAQSKNGAAVQATVAVNYLTRL